MSPKHFLLALIVAAGIAGSTTSAFAWGCIAITADGAYGYSYSYDNRGDAVQRALEECSAHGSGCQIVECEQDK
jgi:hypothetical protein